VLTDQVYPPLTDESWPEIKRQLNQALLDLWVTRQPNTPAGQPRIATSWTPGTPVPCEIQTLMEVQRKMEFITV
jgi:hypothetical protein